MAARELALLGEWNFSGTLAAGNEWRPTPKDGGAELDTGEVAEVLFLEFRAPHNGAGVPDDLEAFYPVLDGQPMSPYLWFPGRYELNVWPPRLHVHNAQYIYFGSPTPDALRKPNPSPLDFTTLKYKQTLTFVFRAGASAVTNPFQLRAWGHRYKKDELARVLGSDANLPGRVSVIDRSRGREFTLDIGTRPVNADTWDILPGGPKQDKPIIQPFWRFARNAQPTTVNVPYQFRFDTGQVGSEQNNLYFPFDTERKVLIVNGLGVRAPANLKQTWIHVSGDPITEEHPRGRIPTTQTNNPIHFGHASPFYPADFPLWVTIPRFADRSLLVWQERAWVAAQDNGSSVPAGEIVVALNGVLIELRQEGPGAPLVQ